MCIVAHESKFREFRTVKKEKKNTNGTTKKLENKS